MLRRLIARLRGFSNDDGVAAVEFSLIALPFVALVAAIFQSFLAQVYISYLDRAVQRFAAELRSGISITKDVNTRDLMQVAIKDRLCPQIPPLMGLDCTKMQVHLFKGANCSQVSVASCWADMYSDPDRAVRKPVTYVAQPLLTTFEYGAAGDSQYLVVFYPLPMFSPIWDTAPGMLLDDGTKVRGLLSTATWINDPSVGVF